MIERLIALAHPPYALLPDPLPIPNFEINPVQRRQVLKKFALVESTSAGSRQILALFPGAEFGESKRWPAEYYAAVAEAKIAQGWQVWVMGSPNDKVVSDAVFAGLSESAKKYCEVLAGRTSLSESIDLMSCAQSVVCNDSGAMHLAAALAIPLVAIFGSTSPEFTPPLGDSAQILQSSLSCAPCFERECPLDHGNCMREQKPELIIKALQ